MKVLFLGKEGFEIPKPATTPRERQNPARHTFFATEEVGTELKAKFIKTEEVKWLNRQRMPIYDPNDSTKQVGTTVRDKFVNYGLPTMAFMPGRITEVNDDGDLATQLVTDSYLFKEHRGDDKPVTTSPENTPNVPAAPQGDAAEQATAEAAPQGDGKSPWLGGGDKNFDGQQRQPKPLARQDTNDSK